MKQTYYKEAFRSLITLSIPTVLEEVLSTLLQYVDTATTEIYTLSLHDALPISKLKKLAGQSILYAFTIGTLLEVIALVLSPYIPVWMGVEPDIVRSEEHSLNSSHP